MGLASHEHPLAAAVTSLEPLGQEKRASTPRQTVAEYPAGKRSQRTGAHASGKLAASELIRNTFRSLCGTSSFAVRQWRDDDGMKR
jgi:hypothetical protein